MDELTKLPPRKTHGKCLRAVIGARQRAFLVWAFSQERLKEEVRDVKFFDEKP
jgi:hypothetical protein